ncbi:TnsA endonuclease N-terminal domain-containing protein [Novosphingobium acidiphilum]|uniref:TnsA endonuclease N-terminal domain-containing protein n=1 Tax=Novosphingobium acidiphilum TaxID=505248 RepID=UPI0004915854|nr:TnsA endonuclease N-terminal domain-containing protein [Novosphingobium acidiphilum]
MRPIQQLEFDDKSCKVGLIVLSEVFEQRKIRTTSGSFTSFIPLETPSGAQWTESDLEAKLVRQLAFSPAVYDLITQPILNYRLDGKARRYTPDIAVQILSDVDEPAALFLIEVKRKAELQRKSTSRDLRFHVGRLAAASIGGEFRVMTEDEILTPYLTNARRFSRYRDGGVYDETVVACRRAVGSVLPATVGEVTELLYGITADMVEASDIVAKMIAYRMVLVDLSKQVADSSVLRHAPIGEGTDPRGDAIIKMLFSAKAE